MESWLDQSNEFERSNIDILFAAIGGSMNNLAGGNVGLGNAFCVKGQSAYVSHVHSLIPTIENINGKYPNYYSNRDKINKLDHFANSLGRISKEKIYQFLHRTNKNKSLNI